jgi:parallel beta-helix repeat protein
MAEPQAQAFWCYDHLDDRDGSVTRFREALEQAVNTVVRQPFKIFQDRLHIDWGQPWRERIRAVLDQSHFLIPLLTPNFIHSEECRRELDYFLEVEIRRGRTDLILPVEFYPMRETGHSTTPHHDHLVNELHGRQRLDWTAHRSEPIEKREKALAKLAAQLARAFERPAPRPSVLRVNPANGKYRTIESALRAAKRWDRIEVAEGVYTEAITIDTCVDIVGRGDRERIVVQAVNEDVISFQADRGRIANLTIRKLGEEIDGRRFGSGVHVTRGLLLLEDNDISSTGLSGVSVQGAAWPRVRGNRIHDGRNEGVHLSNGAGGVLEDNRIYRNGFAGVAIWADADPRVASNNLYEGAAEGVYVGGGGRGLIEHNTIRDNHVSGITIEAGAHPIVKDNHIYGNGPGGTVKVIDRNL